MVRRWAHERSTVVGIATDAQLTPLARELVVVTGKGGVGKTTVTAALAVLAARSGRRVITCEVGGQSRIPALLGSGPSRPGVEVQLADGLWSTSADPEGALADWAGKVVRPRALVQAAVHSRVFSGFVAAAPGARELLSVARAWELTRAHRWQPQARRYDLVVLDAPASGHGVGLLETPRTYREIARVGPIASQAREIDELLRDPARCAVIAVATAEETPVNETLELEHALASRIGHGPLAIVANALLPAPPTAAELGALERQDGRVDGAVAHAVRTRRARGSVQSSQLRRLRRSALAPVLTLPRLRGGASTPAALGELADQLGRQLD